LGAVVAVVPSPFVIAGGVAGVSLLVTAVSSVGVTAVVLTLVVATPLVPVVTGSNALPATVAGVEATSLRIALLTLLTFGSLSVLGTQAIRESHPAVPRVLLGLVALGLLGILAALATSRGSGLLRSTAQAGGQPLLYAALLTLYITVLRADPRARDRFGAAWCLALVLEAIIGVAQLAMGRAYDPLRGYTRVAGTMGSDFLGFFAAAGIFGAAWLKATAESKLGRQLAVAAIASGIVLVALAVVA
jgi:hypothetical protein